MKSRMTTTILTAIVAFSVCRTPLQAADGNTAAPHGTNDNSKPTRERQSSDKTVVKNVVYGLEEAENELYLTSQGLDDDRKIARSKVDFTIPAGSRIAEISLDKLGTKNLMAVVKIKRGAEFDFHCLTFIAPAGGHVRDRHAFFQSKVLTTRENFKILAQGGKHFGGSVFVVLGKRDWDGTAGTSVTEGTFVFSGCPWPPDSEVSHFRVTGPPLPAN